VIHQLPVPVRLTAQADVMTGVRQVALWGLAGTVTQITCKGKHNKKRKRTGALTKSTTRHAHHHVDVVRAVRRHLTATASQRTAAFHCTRVRSTVTSTVNGVGSGLSSAIGGA